MRSPLLVVGGEITDTQGATVWLQRTVLPMHGNTEPCVWVFTENTATNRSPSPRLNVDQARALRDLLDEFIKAEDPGCKVCGEPEQHGRASVRLQVGGWMHHTPCWIESLDQAFMAERRAR